MLSVLGLDHVCEAVYRAILAHPQADLGELSSRLDVPDGELRKALDQLSALALIRPATDRPDCFRALDPEVGMQAALARQRERLAVEQQRVEQIRLAAVHLSADFTAARPHHQIEGIERLQGIDEIRERIASLVDGVAKEVLTLAPGGAQSEASLQAAKPQDRALLQRGVRMRTLYLDSMRNSPATVAYASWLGELGGAVRTAPSLPVRLMILDRMTAIVPIDEQNSAAGAFVLSGSGTVTALCALFDSIWENAAPLFEAPKGHNGHGLTSQEAEALRFLSQGLTDEAVAKRLGISPRTARRIAADLLEKLGARSRFQAGTRAVARGWLTGED